jgi:uncharacterized membrane protein
MGQAPRRVITILGAFLLPGAVLGGAHADAIRYEIKDLGVLPGTARSIATGINASGQVVGVSYETFDALSGSYDQEARSFLYDQGSVHEIDPVGGPARAINSEGTVVGGAYVSINNRGQYVGRKDTSSPNELISGNSRTQIPIIAQHINNSGDIAGFNFTNTSGGLYANAGILHDGNFTNIHEKINLKKAVDSSNAVGINDSGDLLVQVQSADGRADTVLYTEGYAAFLGDLPGSGGTKNGRAINNLGQVVGDDFLYTGGSVHRLTYDDDGSLLTYEPGTFYELQELLSPESGWSNLVALSINDSGQIVGQGNYRGEDRAFLMSPTTVPEPASWAIFGLIAGSIYYYKAKRKDN